MTSTHGSKIVEVYRQLVKHPTPTGAFGRFSKDVGFELEAVWTQRDLEKKETTKFLRNYVIPKASVNAGLMSPLLPVGRPVDISSEIWRVYSNSGNKIAILRKGNPTSEKDKEEKQFLEIWNRTSKLVTVDVAAQEKHGKVYGDDNVFGSLQVEA